MLDQRIRTGTWEKRCLAGWILLILALGTLPLSNFVGHSHWEYIKWVPTADDLRSPRYLADIFVDLIGNTALFFPLGYLAGRVLVSPSRKRHLVVAGSIGAMLSLGIEFYQVYCHSRFPSIFDVMTNVTGTLLGAHFGFSRNEREPVPTHPALTPIPPDRTPVP